LVNIAVAYGRQNKEQEASEYLIYAKKYSEDCSAFHHAIYGVLFSWCNVPELKSEMFKIISPFYLLLITIRLAAIARITNTKIILFTCFLASKKSKNKPCIWTTK
jgi:hypothetical protein